MDDSGLSTERPEKRILSVHVSVAILTNCDYCSMTSAARVPV